MTDEQKKAYLESRGTICPFCRSHNISAWELDAEGPEASQDVECNDCGEEWIDLFTLVDVMTRAEALG